MTPSAVGSTRPLRIATRGSKLALAQADLAVAALEAQWSGIATAIHVVRTSGDSDQITPATALGRGAFVREVQSAVLEGRADVAVHSYKDLPTSGLAGLADPVALTRGDIRDCLVAHVSAFEYLPQGARIATASPRRAAQLLRRRRDLQVVPIRGNVDTRLRILDSGDIDGLVLAAAGLDRLDLAHRITERMDVEQMVPAPGQGAIALEARSDDAEVQALLTPLRDATTDYAVRAERGCLARLGSGCEIPLGVSAIVAEEACHMLGLVVSLDGRRAARMWWRSPMRMPPEEAGVILAELLLESGARELLTEVAA